MFAGADQQQWVVINHHGMPAPGRLLSGVSGLGTRPAENCPHQAVRQVLAGLEGVGSLL